MVTKRPTRAPVIRVFDAARLTDEELIRRHEEMFGRLTAMTRKRFLAAARRDASMATDVALAA
jgi:hypothetical protein